MLTCALKLLELFYSVKHPDAKGIVMSSQKKSGDDKPKSWWQWVLVYPALALALLTALPDWLERIEAWQVNIEKDKLAEANRRDAFFRANIDCLAAPFDWVETPDSVRVDATICDSGDLLLRVEAPDTMPFLHPVRIGDIVSAQTASLSNPLDMIAASFAAHAATRPLDLPQSRPAERSEAAQQLAQTVAVVVCQKFIDDRTLVRHIRVGSQCFDERVDTLTGRIVAKDATSCRTTC